MMFRWSSAALVVCLGIAGMPGMTDAIAQNRKLVIKNGETVELHKIFFIAQCRSIMVGLPEVEVLEGPPEVKLSIKEGDVIPRDRNCAKPVPGGTLLVTAKDIVESTTAKLTYRLKYKTKDGERQTARSYDVSLFP